MKNVMIQNPFKHMPEFLKSEKLNDSRSNIELTKRLQIEILKTFKATISIIESYDLRYWVCSGTLLGAVRHQGFIPWDDDVDIYMPRHDYDILVNEISKSLIGRYRVVSMNDKGYYLPFAKIIDTETTLWELESYPFLLGVFVDIFPLDYFDVCDKIPTIQSGLIKREWDYYRFVGDCGNSVLYHLLLNKNYRVFSYKLLRRIFGDRLMKIAYDRFVVYDNEIKRSEKGDYCLCIYCEDPILKSKWFEDSIEMPFEDMTVRAPVGYKEYLSCCYGDYMKLPPVSERVPKHDHYYLNLNEGLSIVEVKNRMKKGEHWVY